MKPLILCLFLLTLRPVCIYAQVNLTNGLVAYYPFNGNANDYSGNNNNPAFNNATPAAGQSGLPNTAYYFNGTNAYMRIPNSPSLQLGNKMSYFARFKALGYYYGTCHGNNVLSKGTDTETGHFALRYDDAIYTNGQHCNGTPPDTLNENLDIYYSSVTIPYTPYIEKGNWYNVVITTDGDTVRLYINCELVVSTPVPPGGPAYNTADDLYFGMLSTAGYPYWFNGILDEVRLYNRTLNIAEVNALSGCKVAPCVPNVADFNITPSFCNSSSVQFAAAFPDSITTVQWNLGDGATGNGNTVNHSYSNPGSYQVKLSVQFNSGCKDTISKWIPIAVPTADTTVVQTKDTTLCEGAQLLLQALPNAPGYCWSPLQTLSDPSIADPLATPVGATTYYCTALVAETNLVFNGNFSLGDTGFVSDYYSVNPETSAAEYRIGASPSAWSSGLGNCMDHTSGAGNMMMISGLGQYPKIWSQTVAVSPNTNYVFSVWIQSLSAQFPATLNFFINGAILGNPISASPTTCTWNQFMTIWNSGDSTTATLSLVSQNQLAGSFFALDDINFSQYNLGFDSVRVSMADYPNVQVRGDTTICGPYTVPLSATGAAIYSWSPGAGMQDSTVADPLAPTQQSTNYVVSAYDNPICILKDTVSVKVLPVPLFSLRPDSTEVCQGSPFTFQAPSGYAYQWYSSLKGQGLSSQSSYSAVGTATDTIFVAIYDSVCQLSDTLHGILSVDTVPLLTLTKSNDIDCTVGQATLSATGGNNYTWTPASTLSNANTASPLAAPRETTWYTVSVTDGLCESLDSIELLVNFGNTAVSRFTVPGAFTPNGDGINDCFKVEYWGAINTFELSIYNRWGGRVFHTLNPADCWDGRLNGVEEPTGAYIYEIKAASPCAAAGYVFRKGTVTLIR
jgi:gliding motility-associated-like protein